MWENLLTLSLLPPLPTHPRGATVQHIINASLAAALWLVLLQASGGGVNTGGMLLGSRAPMSAPVCAPYLMDGIAAPW